MNSIDFDLGLVHHVEGVEQVIADFAEEFGDAGARVEVDSSISRGYAGLDWLLPTAIVLYVMKEYFAGMLQEAGKDHYTRFAAILRKLLSRANDLPLVRMGTRGKISDDPPGPFSVYYVVRKEYVLKFVFDPNLTEDQQEDSLESLLSQLEELTKESESNLERLCSELGWRLIFRYDSDHSSWRLWDGQNEQYFDPTLFMKEQAGI